ncbi:MAG: glycosyltransferase [Ignavibacteriae bacterium]|nr:glycosyltransferase [Ignavibacteriota bacterium]
MDLLNHIHDLGRLTMNDLVSAYAGAEMFVLPSEFEGFGLPVLEAMACGTPVIISDAAALPEVAGGAAFIVARGNEDALSHAMHRLLTDSLLRNELKDRGRQNVCRFSWDRTAQQTLDVYNRLV